MIIGTYATSVVGLASLLFGISSSARIPGRSANHAAIFNPAFDDSRIRDNADKQLLYDVQKYFKTFTDGDAEGMRAMQTANYNMTDIRKAHDPSTLLIGRLSSDMILTN